MFINVDDDLIFGKENDGRSKIWARKKPAENINSFLTAGRFLTITIDNDDRIKMRGIFLNWREKLLGSRCQWDA